MKKHWVNSNCQNLEPTKRTVSISAIGWPQHAEMSLFEMSGTEIRPSRSFYILTPLFEGQTRLFKDFFLKILANYVRLVRDFLIDGRCISTFFLKISKS